METIFVSPEKRGKIEILSPEERGGDKPKSVDQKGDGPRVTLFTAIVGRSGTQKSRRLEFGPREQT